LWYAKVAGQSYADNSETIKQIFTRYGETVLQRWDQLSHLDSPERSKTATTESLGSLIGELTSIEGVEFAPKAEELMRFNADTASWLQTEYSMARQKLFHNPTTAEHLSPATKVVYEFVRTDLNVPLNRGVIDHPPLLLRTAEAKANGTNGVANGANGSANGSANGLNEEELRSRSRILGTMASEIYEAVRDGKLHERIMMHMDLSNFFDN
jgi:phenylalanine ammonia-lyase